MILQNIGGFSYLFSSIFHTNEYSVVEIIVSKRQLLFLSEL